MVFTASKPAAPDYSERVHDNHDLGLGIGGRRHLRQHLFELRHLLGEHPFGHGTLLGREL